MIWVTDLSLHFPWTEVDGCCLFTDGWGTANSLKQRAAASFLPHFPFGNQKWKGQERGQAVMMGYLLFYVQTCDTAEDKLRW